MLLTMRAAEIVMRSPELAASIADITGAQACEEYFGDVLDADQQRAVSMGESRSAALVLYGSYYPELLLGISHSDKEKTESDLSEEEFQSFVHRRMLIEKSLTGLLRIVPDRQEVARGPEAWPTADAIKYLAGMSIVFAVELAPQHLRAHDDSFGRLKTFTNHKIMKRAEKVIDWVEPYS